METKNTYYKGLDKDTSYLKYPKDRYYHMENFRVVTDLGSSTGAIENEKGNRLDFSIPDTQAVYRIDYVETTETKPLIRINGVKVSPLNYISLEELFESLQTFAGSALGVDYNLFLNDDHILVFGLNNLTVTGTGVSTVVSALSNLKIIHMDHFNDYIVVFTTSNTNANSTSADGQIWLLDYNEETNIVNNLTNGELTPQYHLKYNNLINLSTEHYITKSICRYENSNKARVYWTDYYNPARSFNLFDPEGYAIEPGNLDFISNVVFTKPIITDISSSGQIPAGSAVQFFYQLLSSGRETIISPGSNLVPIYDSDDETADFRDLNGSPQGTSLTKAVSYKINNIDDNYNIIRHIAVLYEFQDLPVIKMFREELIPASREVNVTFTNSEDAIFLDEQELNILNTQFSICKDLAHKDNRLIAANTKSIKFDVEDSIFDSRAYRYKSNQTSVIYNKSGTPLTVDSNFDVPSEHDAINSFNDEDDINYGLYKYQSNGTTLGGTGKYISYEFITKDIMQDELGLATSPQFAGMNSSSRTDIVEGDQTFDNQYNHFKSPFVHMLYGGYMRDEVYRFGIVFYNKKGNVSFAKWIGDIKFPDIVEQPLNEVTTSPTLGTQAFVSKQLGIKFNISIPTQLQNLISGYEIVRVERPLKDRTRLTGGLFYGAVGLGSGGNLASFDIMTGSGVGYNGQPDRNIFAFISPWHQFRSTTNPDFSNSDFLRLNNYYTLTVNTTGISYVSGNGTLEYQKLRVAPNYIKQDINLKGYKFIGRGGAFDVSTDLDPTSTYNSYINRTNVPFVDQFSNAPHYAFASTVGIKLPATDNIYPYGTYCRKIDNQYGGNTFESRSLNVYITTNSYQSGNISSTINIFGGDTYCNYFDFEYLQGNDAANSVDKRVRAVFFCVESPVNTDMRHGNHFNDNRDNPDGPNWQQYTDENYLINPIYLQENNVKQTFIAKPFNINLTDEQPYAIWVSELKINGEEIDNWVKFQVNNQLEVDGIYGPINGIINHQGRVYFLQTEAIGIVPINERIMTQNTDGIELSLGTGDVISVYGYISTKTGCYHTSSIVQSEDYFYFFDARRKKFYRMSLDSKQPLSDLKGLSSYFNTYIKESKLETIDNKTAIQSVGIHGCYDPRYNRVLYTLNKGYSPFNEQRLTLDGVTISYNELMNGFESFYSFLPCVYLSTGRKLLSVDAKTSANRSKVYQHDKGNYGSFYDITYDSNVTLCINAENEFTKEFNNVTWYSECYDNNLIDVPNETFNTIRVFNDHQTTGIIQLFPDKVKRFFRYWRHAILRDINSPQQRARIRNPWVLLELNKYNTNSNRFVCHDVNTHYLL